MGKFDGILICTDLDHTLLKDDKSVSDENKHAIEYFMAEGGYFTFATGRSLKGIDFLISQIKPNAPIVMFNGAAVYDPAGDKMIWETFLDENAKNVLEMVENNLLFAGIEVCAKSGVFVTRGNEILRRQLSFEKIPEVYKHFSDVPAPWRKALFIQEADKLEYVRSAIAESPYAESYSFVQSDPCYYEILPKDASKGEGLLKVAEILGIPRARTIGIGDNENDLTLVRDAGVGVAVANAIPELLDAADFISTNNNMHSISTVIYGIEQNIIEFQEA